MKLDPRYCANFHSRIVYRNLHRAYNKVLKEVGIEDKEFTLLQIIKNNDGISVNEATSALFLEQPIASKLVSQLVRGGYILSERAKDKRQRSLKLTGKGKELIKSANAEWRKIQRKVIKAIGEHEFSSYIKNSKIIAELQL